MSMYVTEKKKGKPIFEVKDVSKSFDGRPILKKLSLIQSSGFDVLDNEVLRAVSNSGHYPSAPLSLSKKQYSFKLPIKFEI